jgi:hypothetical protein
MERLIAGLKGLFPAGRGVVTVNLEGSTLRLLASRGRRVLSWLSMPVNPQLVADGQISSEEDMGTVLQRAVRRLGVRPSQVLAAFSGARSLSRVIALPRARELKPGTVIPREARRQMGPTVEQSYLFWSRVGAARSEAEDRYYVLAVPRSRLDSLTRTLVLGGLKPAVIDLKAMALARCVPGPSAVIMDLEPASLDIILVVGSLPLAAYTVLMEGVAAQNEEEMAARMAEEVRRGLQAFNARNPGQVLGAGTPLYLTGGHPLVGDRLFDRIESAAGFAVLLPEPPFRWPEGFSAQGFMVNLGLLLRSRYR